MMEKILFGLSDASAPRLWQFSLDTQEFTSYSFDGLNATTFLTQDNKWKIMVY